MTIEINEYDSSRDYHRALIVEAFEDAVTEARREGMQAGGIAITECMFRFVSWAAMFHGFVWTTCSCHSFAESAHLALWKSHEQHAVVLSEMLALAETSQ